MQWDTKPAPLLRVLLTEVPGLMASMIQKKTSAHADIEIVEAASQVEDPAALVTRHRANVVVTSLAGKEVPTSYRELVFAPPHVTLIAISKDAHDVDVYERKVVRDVEQLVEILRELAHSNIVTQ
jgi:hypothetical protein